MYLHQPSLPNPNLPFQLYTDEKQHTAVGALVQPVGKTLLPIAYLSRQLDPIERGWQPCLRALAAAITLTTEALKINLQLPLQVFSPHRLTELLSQHSLPHLRPSRIQLLHLLFIENPNITLSHCSSLNLATLLPCPPYASPLHSCTEILKLAQSPRPDLLPQPLPSASITLFIDGSFIPHPTGPRRAAYAIVIHSEVIETCSLPLGTTSQQAELVALTRALSMSQNKEVNIYTDSKYSFLIAHSHCMIWKERGFLTTKGTPVLNGKLIAALIQAVQLPSKVAIIHCKGHQSLNSPIAAGNAFADRVAKDMARNHPPPTSTLCFLCKSYSPQYSASELQILQSTPGVQFTDDWAFKHNLLILPEKQKYQIIKDIHNSLHIGPKALYQFLNPLFHPHHLLSTIQEVQSSCTVCAKTNSQGSCLPRRQLHQLHGFLPGQDWQIDFTHMPKHKQYCYLLTIVDTFSGWIEAYPTASESAGTVATHLIQDIVPRFGLPATI
uniref:uncharacterized protein LOC118152063 n=1 Tax=Callithrix jacchus TaxID=9483 RepID=UPI0023DD1E7B|nr:uncharacterized protein LOC118152063 [Callithrix jacchus]